MTGQSRVADALCGDLSESGLQSAQELGLQLAVKTVTGILCLNIAAHVLIEQHWVGDLVGVLAVATDGNVHIKTDVGVNDTEGDRRGSAELVAQNFLQVEEVHSLILAGISTEGEAALQVLPAGLQAVAKTAVEDGAFGGGVPGEFTGFCCEFNDLALIDDHHTLTFINSDDRTVGDNIIGTLSVAAAGGSTLLTLGNQNIFRHAVAVEELSPLVAQNAAYTAKCCFNKTHNNFSFM